MAPSSTSHSARILIVDDDFEVSILLKDTLERSGYQIEQAMSGTVAIELATTSAFDLALVDLNLGDIHGLVVVDYFRKNFPDMAVLILTGYSSLDTVLKAMHLGVDEYLAKPVDAVHLRERIRQALDKHHPAPPAGRMIREPALSQGDSSSSTEDRLLRLGCLTVDPNHTAVACKGQTLRLKPIEMRMLVHLAHQSPRSVGAGELLQVSTGYQMIPLQVDEIVRQHIQLIQDALEYCHCDCCTLRSDPSGYVIVEK